MIGPTRIQVAYQIIPFQYPRRWQFPGFWRLSQGFSRYIHHSKAFGVASPYPGTYNPSHVEWRTDPRRPRYVAALAARWL